MRNVRLRISSLSSYMKGVIKTKENGQYNDAVKATCQDLVMMGVGISNIEQVAHTVLTNFTNMNIECLPKATFARLMYTESRRLSQPQVAEELLKDYESSSRTLHTDGTSKFGKHYGTYDVVTDQGQTLTAVLTLTSGDTKTQVNVLIDIFSEIEGSLQSSEENISNKIISSIKNIMSDRHIVQKKFNTVFQTYRTSVLPAVFEKWDTFSENIQKNFIKVNEF